MILTTYASEKEHREWSKPSPVLFYVMMGNLVRKNNMNQTRT
ncbi:hypothetical protein HMPREF1141_2929 [Clostridium sp. MSTE9]|nr:hypothetical protein HMPREF1141_2929 [Clostridium sp. MSTE9]